MKRRLWWIEAARNADGGGAGGAAGGAAGGQQQQQAGGGQQQQQQGQQQAADYWPQGLDVKFKGADAKSTLDNIAKHFGEMPKAPGAAKDYAYTPSEQLAPYFSGDADKAVLGMFQEVAHGLGMTQKQFDGAVNGLFGKMAEKGLLPKPMDVKAEFQKLGGTTGDAQSQIIAGQTRVLEIEGAIDGLATRGNLKPEMAKAMKSMMTSADQMLAIEALIGLIPGVKGPNNGGSTTDGFTDHERALRQMYPTHFKQAS